MLSVVVGAALGWWMARWRTGLLVALVYGVVAGIISTNVSFREGAGLFPPILALVGFSLARVVRWVCSARGVGSMREVSMHSEDATPRFHDAKRQPQPSTPDQDRDVVYAAAGLAHVTFLNSVGRELDDLEFAAAALGAFDGTAQAHALRLNDLDMLAMGSAFVLRQMNDLERMTNAPPSAKGDVIGRAMKSPVLEEIRDKTSRFAFAIARQSLAMAL